MRGRATSPGALCVDVSRWEALLALHIQAAQLPAPVREYRFMKTRRWRFDFAWPLIRVAAEVEGGVFFRRGGGAKKAGRGAHDFENDCEKHNAAAYCGWRVFRFPPRQIQSGAALRLLETVLRSAT
jgi:very-short-patch-repair endonuclease